MTQGRGAHHGFRDGTSHSRSRPDTGSRVTAADTAAGGTGSARTRPGAAAGSGTTAGARSGANRTATAHSVSGSHRCQRLSELRTQVKSTAVGYPDTVSS